LLPQPIKTSQHKRNRNPHFCFTSLAFIAFRIVELAGAFSSVFSAMFSISQPWIHFNLSHLFCSFSSLRVCACVCGFIFLVLLCFLWVRYVRGASAPAFGSGCGIRRFAGLPSLEGEQCEFSFGVFVICLKFIVLEAFCWVAYFVINHGPFLNLSIFFLLWLLIFGGNWYSVEGESYWLGRWIWPKEGAENPVLWCLNQRPCLDELLYKYL